MDSGTTNIPTLIVAMYAAVVSTITGTVQFLNYRRDRDKIKLRVQKNMGIYGDPRYEHRTLTIITVVNAGRRPVTITSVGMECLFPNKHAVFADINPKLPHELTEGKYLLAQVDQDGLDFSTVQCWFACDGLGRTHRLTVASWPKRWLSNYRLKHRWKQEKKNKAATWS